MLEAYSNCHCQKPIESLVYFFHGGRAQRILWIMTNRSNSMLRWYTPYVELMQATFRAQDCSWGLCTSTVQYVSPQFLVPNTLAAHPGISSQG